MAAFRGSKPMVGGNGVAPEVDPALYRNLVEMIPLMESFMEQQGARTSMFGHQASMIYTPAPLRESLYKPYESPLKVRKGIHTPKRTPNRELSRELNREEPKEETRWEESENILRRIEGDTAQEDSSKDTRHLLVEIEELKQKLWEKDCLLETIGQRSNQILESNSSQTDDVSQKHWEFKGTEGNDPQGGAFEFDSQPGNNATNGNGVTEDKDEKSEEMKLLQTQIDKLRQELAEKDRYVQSAQLELREQQQGLGEMRLLLEQAERGMVKTNHKANSMEAELNTLRCQVLTLRYQLDAVDATDLADGSQLEQDDADREGPPYRVDMVSTIASEEVDQKTTFLVCVSGPNDEEQVNTVSEGSKEEKEKLELARRKYLAAVIAAREKPIGESLLMVAECRKQLNNYLKDIPAMQDFGTQL
ncbi:hypothetical protein M758_6G073400 [Ceratodon purpureus]|uniref:Uncharacterized protein n=1 Tax=Ceratodon purpureus TaxID=3225 RepID=A0A8T0HF59_CERPU|nr:hypothetical protein KC19_6G077800 [Ceratodon purpureus]KAG0613057.1 hypothetical protein M758_6G073400 [Ceratodon purpureus]